GAAACAELGNSRMAAAATDSTATIAEERPRWRSCLRRTTDLANRTPILAVNLARRSSPVKKTSLGFRAHDAQHRVHSTLAMIGNRAPEHVPARHELQLAVDDLAGLDVGEAEDPRAADAAQIEVVRVLTAVD